MQNMDISKLILDNREEKNRFIQTLTNNYQVITLKANIPGINKNTNEAYLLINYFNQILLSKGYKKSNTLNGADGPMYIYLTDKDKDVKDEMVKIEEENVLGRFIDIDVFNGSISNNRGFLRKCYLCDKPAFVCSRNKEHTMEEITLYIQKNIEKELVKIVKLMCDEAILEELNLHPKFGLVTPYTNGSHTDMNYELMVNAKNAILDSFVEMFLVGYENNDIKKIFALSRQIGIDAEKKMFKATNNINAYKGLIFDLGLIVSALGYKLSHLNQCIDIFEIIKQMTKGITNELKCGNETFGKYAYQTYNIGGARLEAENGFPHVQKLIKDNLDNTASLIYLISNIDDTVLLKRCGTYQKYLDIKIKFKELVISESSINDLNKYCINNNLSFGGAADLLIVTIFLKKINQKIKIY